MTTNDKKKDNKIKKAKETKKTKSNRNLADKDEGFINDIQFRENELVIKFDHEHQILPKLLELAKHFSESNLESFNQPGVTVENVLGGARARQIVSSCAQSNLWTATLNDLGLNPLIFRACIAAGIIQAGYPPPNIPATLDTRLIDVVYAIQGATP